MELGGVERIARKACLGPTDRRLHAFVGCRFDVVDVFFVSNRKHHLHPDAIILGPPIIRSRRNQLGSALVEEDEAHPEFSCLLQGFNERWSEKMLRFISKDEHRAPALIKAKK